MQLSITDMIERRLIQGDVAQLEQILLCGQGDQLIGKQSTHFKAQAFLRTVSTYKVKSFW